MYVQNYRPHGFWHDDFLIIELMQMNIEKKDF